MQAKDVKVYESFENNLTQFKRFYSFYNDSVEKLELSNFLNSTIDVDLENNVDNVIYGVVNGKIIKKYKVVLTFLNLRNNKDYIVYTDCENDSNGNKKIYSAVYDMDKNSPFVSFLTTLDEWTDVCQVMDAIFLFKH